MTVARTALAVLTLGFTGALVAQPAQRIAPGDASYAVAPAAALAPAARTLADARIYGVPGSPQMAERTIDITPSTRWINVKQDETVVLRNGDKAFVWTFATWSIGSFPLGRIAPPELSTPAGVRVYVAPNPTLDGGR